jgi:hypothetical protein
MGHIDPALLRLVCSVICLRVFDKRKETLSDRMKAVSAT